MKSLIAGLIGIIALALLVSGHFLGLGYTVGVGIALSAIFGYGWPHYLGIPAKKTLGTVIALTGAGAALTAGQTSGADFLAWAPLHRRGIWRRHGRADISWDRAKAPA